MISVSRKSFSPRKKLDFFDSLVGHKHKHSLLAHAYFGEKIQFWIAHHILNKRSMPKTEEKQCDAHTNKPIHVRVRVFDMIVMVMSQ